MTKGGGHPRKSSHRDPHTQASRRPRPLRPLQLPLWQPRSLVCTPPTPHPAPSALPPSSALLTRRSGDITARTSAERGNSVEIHPKTLLPTQKRNVLTVKRLHYLEHAQEKPGDPFTSPRYK